MCAQRAKKIIYAKGGKPLMKYRTGRNNSISSNRHPAYVFEAVKEVAAQISEKTSMEFRQLMVFLCECSKRRISRRQKLKPMVIKEIQILTVQKRPQIVQTQPNHQVMPEVRMPDY